MASWNWALLGGLLSQLGEGERTGRTEPNQAEIHVAKGSKEETIKGPVRNKRK